MRKPVRKRCDADHDSSGHEGPSWSGRIRPAVQFLTALVIVALPSYAGAAVFDVDTTTDSVDVNIGDGLCADASGFCSVRAAVQEANASGGNDKINIPPGTYALTLAGAGEDAAATGDLDLTDDVWICGLGSSTITVDGNGTDRVFHVLGGSLVTFTAFMVRNGAVAGSGGGIEVAGSTALSLEEMAVVDSTATGRGGGVRTAGGSLTLRNVTLSGNGAATGAGLATGDGPVSMTNVTIARNAATDSGGGVEPGGGAFTVLNAIVATNTGGDCGAPIGPGLKSLESDGSCGFSAGGGIVADPLLGSLADNGGPSWTHALNAGSPAIDSGDPACPSIDQRGAPRPVDGDSDTDIDCDIGAIEQTPAISTLADLQITKDDGVASYVPGGQVVYTIVAANGGPSPVVSARIVDNIASVPQVQSTSWQCTPAGGATCTAGPVAGSILDTIDLPLGGSATYTLTVDLLPGATGDLVNTAHILAPFWVVDPDLTNDSATDTDTQEAPQADLTITKDDGLVEYTPGAQVSYTIVVSNAGPSGVTGASVADAVTALPQVVSASWTCVAAGGATCTAGPVAGDLNDTSDVPVGGTATYTLVVDLDPSATGDLVNSATVTAPPGTTDPDATNNTASDTDTEGSPVADIGITKDDGVASYTPGGSVTYTIVVSNAGPSDVVSVGAGRVNVKDVFNPIPQASGGSWTCVAAGGGTCTAGPVTGNINDNIDLPVGGTATYTLVLDLDPGATGDLTNTATVTMPNAATDPNPANDSAQDTDTQGSPGADLAVTKDDGVASYTPGGSVTYTIAVSNAGPSNVTGATVTDAVTALPQVAGASWTCVGSGGASCTAGPVVGDIDDTADVPVGGTATYTLVVNLDPDATGDLVNAATVAPPVGTTDLDAANDSAVDTDTEGAPVADLWITKDDGVASYTPGGSVTYTIIVGNNGPSDVTGATVTDAIVALPQVTSASWTCDSSNGASCTAGPVAGDINDTAGLPVGGTAKYTLVVNLDPSATGDLVNTATVVGPVGASDPDPANNSATDTDTEGGPVADLSITNDDGVASYTPGGSVTYTIVVSNAGPSSVIGATVTDAVMALPQVASASWTCVAAGGAACTAGPVAGDIVDTVDLPIGGSAAYTLIVNLDSSASGDLVNVAGVTGPVGAADPDGANDTASDTDTRGSSVADIGVTKDDGVTSYTPGGSVTYTIVVSNAGPSDIVGSGFPGGGATVTDSVTALPQVTSASWSCLAAGGATCTAGPVAGDISDTIDIPVGGTATYTLVTSIDASATGDLINTATVAVPGGASDPVAANNSASDTDTVGARVADLSITKDDGIASYTPGGSVNYTIVVSNAGPSDVTGATVTDAVTALAQVTSASWTCVGAGGATCTGGPVVGDLSDTIDVPTGGTATYTVVANLDPGATDDLVNTATVAEPVGATDPVAADNTATDTDTEGSPVADLAITKDDGVAGYLPAGSVTYTIVVSNAGPSDVTGATVTDAVTALPQVASASWTCLGAGGATCTAGPVAGGINDTIDVPVGGTATYTLVANIEPGATGDLVNTATVTEPVGTTDPAAANNSASDSDTQGSLLADLSITKDDGVSSYTPGGTVTYTIVAGNAGPSAVTGATVADAVTALPQVASASWTCLGAGGATCTAGPVVGDINDTVDLPVGGTATYTLIVNLDPSASGNLVNSADVTEPAGAADPDGANNGAIDTDTQGSAVADIGVTKDDGVTSYTPGGSVTYTIVVGNGGPSEVSGATVTDAITALPQVASASWTCNQSGGASCTSGPSSGDINDTIDLPVGGTATYTLVVTLDPSATGDLVNTAAVAEPAGTTDPAAANNSAIDIDTEGARVADLSIAKDDGVVSYTPGGSLTYTVVVSNAGPSDVTGATVTDAVTALPQVTSASWSCVAAGGATCTAGPVTGDVNDAVDVPVGGTATYTLVASLDPSATGDLANTAIVTEPAGTSDPAAADNSATDTDTAGNPVADLSITKDDGVSTYTPGGSVTYTVVVTNAGPSAVSGASVTDAVTALPQVASASWTCVASAGAGCTAGPVAGDVNDSVDLPVGGTATYTLVVAIDPAATGDLVNTASVGVPLDATDPDAAADSAVDVDAAAAASADLSLAKTVDNGLPNVGETVTFTLTVDNAGPAHANGVVVIDPLPGGYTYVGHLASAGAYDGATGLWTVGVVPAGAAASLNIMATVNATGDHVNAAEITAANEADPDSIPGNGVGNGEDDEAQRDTTVIGTDGAIQIAGSSMPGDTLAITVTDADLDTDPGASESVQVVVTNDTTGETENVLLTETGPGTGVFQGSLATVYAASAGSDNDGVLVTQGGDSLTATYLDELTSDPAKTSELRTDQGTVVGGDGASLTITPSSAPGDTLALQVSDADPNADPGAVDSVQVTVVNDMTGESELLTLTETGTNSGIFQATLTTAIAAGGGPDNDGMMNTRAGDTLTVFYMDSPDAAGGSSMLNATSVVGVVDAVLLSKDALKAEVMIGGNVPYVLRARNTTAGSLLGVLLSDRPPAGFKIVEGSATLVEPGADLEFGTADDIVTPVTPTEIRPLEFGPFDLGPGESIEVHYRLRAGSGALLGDAINRATALLGGAPMSNTARATVAVIEDPILDQSTIIGKVFEDPNRNGLQERGEAGVAKAMVVLDDGTYALTDRHGRYHIPAVRQGHRMLKIDLRSLPPGTTASTDDGHIVWITPGLTARVNFGVVVPQHVETIGRPEELGVAIAGETDHHPLEVLGQAEELSLLVNDRRIPLDSPEVRLRLQRVDKVVTFTGDQPDDPLEFGLDVGTAAAVSGWRLTVFDAAERPVRRFEGHGPPPDTLPWDGRTDGHEPVAAGEIYLYQLEIQHPDGTSSASMRRVFGVNRNTMVALELTGNAFDLGRSTLSANAKKMLQEATAILADYPDERILVAGHTDSLGTDSFNMALSRSRAEAAAEYLEDELGFPQERILLQWHGESRPVVSNDLPEGREINRRVEVKAEVEELESAEITDRYRAMPEVRIDGASVELGRHGRFAATVEPGRATALEVEMTNAHGRAVRVRVGIPLLDVISPRGEATISEIREENGCRIESGRVVCRLEAVTDPGNRVTLDGREIITRFDGRFGVDLPLEVGPNVFGILARNGQGVSRSANLAITVRDRDADGNLLVLTEGIPNLTVNLPAQGARLTESNLALSGHTDPGNRVWVNERELEVSPEGHFESVVELPTGKSRLALRVQDPNGRVGAIERDVEVASNQLFLMAFADGEFGKLSASGAVEGIENAGEFYTEGRLAFYMKGRIRGKYLITAAFDSGRQEIGDLFSDLSGDEAQRLLSNLDPDKYYAVYGDDSSVVYDVESQGKLYLALESEQVQAVVGNYPLDLTDTELAAYRRTLYGARAVYRSASRSKFGKPDTEVVVFAADVRHTHVRDELSATGGSLYYLSHRDVVEGSEEITLVVRDKRTGLVLSRTRQRQNTDYTIKYPEGRLMFHRTVSSIVQDASLVDQAVLPGHPVFIQADYETVAGSLDKTATGTRVRQQIGDHVAVGGTYIEDELSTGNYELAGVDAEIRPDEGTRLTFEFADSSGNDSFTFVSDDGGLTYTPVAATGLEQGSAWKAAAELDVGSWFGRPDRHQLDLYYKKLEDGFFSSGNFLEQGTEKIGVRGSFTVTERDTVQLRHDREERMGASVTPGAADQTVLSSALWRHRRQRWRLDVEYLTDEVEDGAGNLLRESSLGAARFWTQLTKKLSAELEHQSTLSGPDNDQSTAGVEYRALPNLALQLQGTNADKGNSAQAGAVLTMGESEIYVKERLADGLGGEKTSTVVGARSPLGEASKVYTEYQVDNDERGGRTISLVGLQRQWEPTQGFRFLLSGESSNLDTATTEAKRSTLGASVTYANRKGLALTSRNELRVESGDTDRDQYVTFSRVDYKLNDDLTLLAKYRYSKTENRDTGLAESKIDERSLGCAYRPTGSDRFNSLAQYTRLLDFRPMASGQPASTERVMDVVSLETLFQINPRLEWVTKSAARFQEENDIGQPAVESSTYLVVQRFNVNVWKPVDLGLEFRALHQREADDRRLGWLSEVMWKVQRHFRVGAGYNFTDFSDNEFSQNNYSMHGWFFRVQGKY